MYAPRRRRAVTCLAPVILRARRELDQKPSSQKDAKIRRSAQKFTKITKIQSSPEQSALRNCARWRLHVRDGSLGPWSRGIRRRLWNAHGFASGARSLVLKIQ